MSGKMIISGFFATMLLTATTAPAIGAHATWPSDWNNWNDPAIWVTVGSPNNDPDTEVMSDETTGYGSVGYTFAITKFEVTNAQYLEFLNAKASIGDPLGLYHSAMGPIERSGTGTVEDPWVYSAFSLDGQGNNRPARGVSFWDAARFCNWLQNGREDADTESGAYINIGNNSTFARQPGARYVISTEDEWYKAAYYTEGGIYPRYNDFPMQTEAGNWPSNKLWTPDPGNNANFVRDSHYTIEGPEDKVTVVGDFENSESWYGTFDQGGNVLEWTEGTKTSYRIMRGGAFWNVYGALQSRSRQTMDPSQDSDLGFRIVNVAEPSTISLLGIAVASMGVYVWRRWKHTCVADSESHRSLSPSGSSTTSTRLFRNKR